MEYDLSAAAEAVWVMMRRRRKRLAYPECSPPSMQHKKTIPVRVTAATLLRFKWRINNDDHKAAPCTECQVFADVAALHEMDIRGDCKVDLRIQSEVFASFVNAFNIDRRGRNKTVLASNRSVCGSSILIRFPVQIAGQQQGKLARRTLRNVAPFQV